METNIIESTIVVPEDVALEISGNKVTVTGEKGNIMKDFSHTKLNIEKKENTLKIWAINPKKRKASLVNTISTHVKNMIKGVSKGFKYKMKIIFVHFPMNIRVQDNKLIIMNFIGERRPRQARIVGDTSITIEGEDLILEGIKIEEVAQTAANIQQATKIRRKDLRKFLDGIYVYSKE
jgi:large subunit ribosomal protein L6